MMLGVKKPIFIAIGSLCLNAYKARVTVSTREKKSIPDPPEYIAKLLKQRETAKLSRAAASISEKGKEMFNSEQDLITLDKDSGSKRPSNPIQRDALAGDDAFWLNESLQGSVLPDSAAEMMNMDTEDFLAQDYLFDTPDGEVIDWVQWDSWLGNIDPACSNIRPGLS
ncbi:hypothetical protein PVAG01_11241 [Phlyctema vagabunda]|uniref:Uncharacterized protein n=1 Tax=Phlyctema vagabunda TaxID=108571 RepID=A0ABR4P1Q6_9HELO